MSLLWSIYTAHCPKDCVHVCPVDHGQIRTPDSDKNVIEICWFNKRCLTNSDWKASTLTRQVLMSILLPHIFHSARHQRLSLMLLRVHSILEEKSLIHKTYDSCVEWARVRLTVHSPCVSEVIWTCEQLWLSSHVLNRSNEAFHK